MTSAPANGFTLVELLIGLAVGSLAVLAAGLGLNASIAARDAGAEASRTVERMIAARTLAHRLLEAAAPIRMEAGDAGEPDRWRMAGDASQARFVAELWGDVGAAGLWEVEIALAPDEVGTRLTVLGRLFDPRPPSAGDAERGDRPPQPPEPFQRFAEASAAPGAALSYAARATDGSLAWSDIWRGEDGWPLMIAFDPDGPGGSPAFLAGLPQPVGDPQ
ncbi:prepilin-type N-terminal cleavage/methylation domain-containing protein [bacterium]|nr:prepilin-type N-terminal cleavage/methylation domain-containing protein [bacterium]